VVTAITGVTRYRIELQGRTDHADGTSMAERCYALAGAAQVISAVERLWMDGAGVGTVGRLTVSPNSINVVPETVAMWTDMRSLDSAPLDARREVFAAEVAGPRGLRADLDLLSREEPVPANPAVGSVLTGAADRTGRPYLRLPSHAANQMAKIAPIGMLFATSRDGRSHCPEKWTEELAPGLRP
jgi:beta-ureidopropionase / N-carbamoyl-L-amino-acid hydrolase